MRQGRSESLQACTSGAADVPNGPPAHKRRRHVLAHRWALSVKHERPGVRAHCGHGRPRGQRLCCQGVWVPYPTLPWGAQVYELMVPLDAPEVLEKTLDVLAQFAFAIRRGPYPNTTPPRGRVRRRQTSGCAGEGVGCAARFALAIGRACALAAGWLRCAWAAVPRSSLCST